MGQTRICSKCKQEYELSAENFHRTIHNGSGFIYRCKACVNTLHRQRQRQKYAHKPPELLYIEQEIWRNAEQSDLSLIEKDELRRRYFLERLMTYLENTADLQVKDIIAQVRQMANCVLQPSIPYIAMTQDEE